MSDLSDFMNNEFALTPQEGPFYTDFLVNVQEDNPQAGLADCPWSATETPRLYAIKDVIIEHFNLVYKYREIGAETEERWQYTVDKVFDNVKRRYEFALGQYNDNEIEKVGKYFRETFSRDSASKIESSNSREGTTTTTVSDSAKSTFNDTPIHALIESANYASSINDDTLESESVGETSTESSDVKDITLDDDYVKEYNEAPKSIMESVNESINKFRDLIDDFVDEFHVCFISTLGRI